MSLLIINGSPRNRKSNSKILADKFLEGFSAVSQIPFELHHLASESGRQALFAAFESADMVILIFPLYTDSMPAIVKTFFEALFHNKSTRSKTMGFVVQSGFAESVHSTFVAAWLEKYCRRMGFSYLGTVIKGGVEGIQIMPAGMTKKLFADFTALGRHFGNTGQFDPVLTEKLAKPFRLSAFALWRMRMMPAFLKNFYWNMNLRKNKAFDLRFDQPFKA